MDLAKSRLSAALDPARRGALARRMLGHVLEALRDAEVPELFMASDDLEAQVAAAKFGGRAIQGVGDADLNAAATIAARTVQSGGASDLLLVMADLPWLTSEDVIALIEAGRRSAVVIAEAKDGGTNALLVRPPTVLKFAFATNTASAQNHADLARKAGIEPIVLRRPGLARDIDTPADLANLAADHPAYQMFRHVA
jgi:2-phospho-L-lactate guanylyltransferase